MTEAEDPRARFRHLPEPIRPHEMVETTDVNRPVEKEPIKPVWEQIAMGGSGIA
jgi:hypothetical protein